MALPGKKKLYLPLLIIGIICVAVALYLLGEHMGQVKLRERFNKIFDKTRNEKLGITKEEIKEDYELPGGWKQNGGELSVKQRKFVSKQIMMPLFDEVMRQEMPWGRWSTRDAEWPDDF